MQNNYLIKEKRINQQIIDCSLTNNFDEKYSKIYPYIKKSITARLIANYPNCNYKKIKNLISQKLQIKGEIIFGNGSEDLIIRTNRYIEEHNLSVGIVRPIFYRIEETLREQKKINISQEDLINGSIEADVIWAQNPNLFNGQTLDREKMLNTIDSCKNTLFIFDEAGIFSLNNWQQYSLLQYVHQKNNLIVISSFSKMFGISGLRAGFLIAPINISNEIKRKGLTFPLSTIAELFLASIFRRLDVINNIRLIIQKNKNELKILLSRNPNIIQKKTLTNCIFSN
ncbi:MAG: Histidinol-phosphate aminotransferase [Syntrophomonadaceae bacterium]|nr:Histidinol-phosphate aminotransferase [Bacillota bacterium]